MPELPDITDEIIIPMPVCADCGNRFSPSDCDEQIGTIDPDGLPRCHNCTRDRNMKINGQKHTCKCGTIFQHYETRHWYDQETQSVLDKIFTVPPKDEHHCPLCMRKIRDDQMRSHAGDWGVWEHEDPRIFGDDDSEVAKRLVFKGTKEEVSAYHSELCQSRRSMRAFCGPTSLSYGIGKNDGHQIGDKVVIYPAKPEPDYSHLESFEKWFKHMHMDEFKKIMDQSGTPEELWNLLEKEYESELESADAQIHDY